MGTAAFAACFVRGEPLIDVVAVFHPNIDVVAAVERINALFEDLDFHRSAYYDKPNWRIGTATQSAPERIFAWRVKRFPERPGLDETYCWKAHSEPNLRLSGLQDLIQSIGMSQPGADDNGQWWA